MHDSEVYQCICFSPTFDFSGRERCFREEKHFVTDMETKFIVHDILLLLQRLHLKERDNMLVDFD